MYTTEAIVRTVVRQIAMTPGLLEEFVSPERDQFLESWVRSGRPSQTPKLGSQGSPDF